ncbi:hypothetical protein [Noviherbaspirillum aerium]|uniref:hypothetical protein n=1 Tax=Noviherbaspirillum aerium TaxID=2588497 RepID=UPI00178C6F7B|nr:hypothetical protein [Noviherbaspirillum aerium]
MAMMYLHRFGAAFAVAFAVAFAFAAAASGASMSRLPCLAPEDGWLVLLIG